VIFSVKGLIMAVNNFSRDIAEKQPAKPREDLVRHIPYFLIKCFMP